MKRDYFDVWGGLALAIAGAAVALYTLANYDFGVLRNIGPGFFPCMLGLLLAGLGLVIAVPAWLRRGGTEEIALREMGVILAAVVLFALLVERAGVLATCVACVLICTIPAPRRGWLWRLVLALAVTFLTWAVFIFGLGIALPLFPWSR